MSQIQPPDPRRKRQAKSMNHAGPAFSGVGFLANGGETGRRILEMDWTRHPLGPPETWPRGLKVVIQIMLTSRFAMWLGWGPDFHFFFYDAYSPTLGIKRDWAIGVPASTVWAEIWSDIGPRAESVVRTGIATWDQSLLLFLERSGYPEETYHTFSYSPVPDDEDGIGGMLCVVTEETERVIGERRLALLRDLGAELASVNDEGELFQIIETRLSRSPKDVPFALVYLFGEDDQMASLACTHNVQGGGALAPERMALGFKEEWPATDIIRSHQATTVENLGARFGQLPTGPWARPPRAAQLVPIAQQGQSRPAGFFCSSA